MAEIVLTEPAEDDLLDIEHYIYFHLKNPQASIRITNGIIGILKTLEKYPCRSQYADDDLLKNTGLRMIRFDNYNIFYYYEENLEIVHIIRILHNKANWHNILKQ